MKQVHLEAAHGSFAEHVGRATTATKFSATVDAKMPTISGLSVRGINLLNAFYHCKGRSIPVAFELVVKSETGT